VEEEVEENVEERVEEKEEEATGDTTEDPKYLVGAGSHSTFLSVTFQSVISIRWI
jgi:hypothetical protein